NAKGEVKITKTKEVEYGPGGLAYVVEKRRLKGLLSQEMELVDFPFDIQDLSVLITSDLNDGEVELVEDRKEVSFVNTLSFGNKQEWILHQCVLTEPRPVSTGETSAVTQEKPGICFKCCATRQSGFFVWNIMFVMALITALSVVTFTVDRTKPQNRIQLSFILVLAAVSFKFVASQSVPKISYPTYLDKYILTTMSYLFIVALWHGVITVFNPGNESYGIVKFFYGELDAMFSEAVLVRLDLLAFVSCAAAVLMINILFYIFIKIKVCDMDCT
ncbi:hypothetical protein BaRGS_00024902, partial [Batillaria attramentaria]